MNLVLLMCFANIEWIHSRRKVAVFEGEELAKIIYLSTLSSNGQCSTNGKMDYLSLENINIDVITLKSFGNLTNLCSIDLHSNKIKTIESNAFSKLFFLEKVVLSKNDINVIQAQLFQYNRKIQTLDISLNRIGLIQKSAFAHLSELEYLYLSENPLKHLDGNTFSNNKKLLNLDLSNIQLDQISDSLFKNLVELEDLDLSNNNIVQISEKLFESNTELDRLNLDGNSIEDLHEKVFDDLGSLLTLNLNRNKISKFNEKCFNNMKNLAHLYLSHNNIESLNSNLFRNNNGLMMLHISNNSIEQLPKGLFKQNEQLQEISLDRNRLKEVTSENFEKNKNLIHIILGYNNINRIGPSVFHEMSYLEHLDLQFNEVSELPTEIFHNINNSLKKVFLNNNQLQEIDENVFSVGMGKLRILNLAHNKITNYKFFKHSYFPQLLDFHLNNNKLKEVTNILYNNFSSVNIRIQNLFLEFNEIEFELIDGKFMYNRVSLWELKFLNISNNRISRFYPIFTSLIEHPIVIDFRNNRILDMDLRGFPKQNIGIGKFYLWESIIPTENAYQVKSFTYYGHEKNLKLEKYYLTVSAVLRNIEEISCEDNSIIVSLEIHQNQLNQIDCLSKVWTLHFLDVSYNKLKTLTKAHFAKMIYLETIDISHNQLTSLDLQIFAASVNLAQFYFDECLVTYSWQYYRITDMFQNLTNISMQNNSIFCPLLSTIIQKFHNANITITDYENNNEILLDRGNGISCESYESIKNLLQIIMYHITFIILFVVFIVLFIVHRYNNYV